MLTSDEIAHEFLSRARDSRIWITRKQANWLYSQFSREIGQRVTHNGTPTANGNYVNGQTWTLSISHNGSGLLQVDKPISTMPIPTKSDDDLRAFNAKVYDLIKSGDMDGARKLAQEIAIQ